MRHAPNGAPSVARERTSFGTRVRWCAFDRLLKDPDLGIVMDVGSGRGVFCNLLAGRYRLWVNLDQELDGHGRFAHQGTVFPIKGDAHLLPLASGSVDTVFLVSVLEHFQSASTVVREVQRVLVPGGKMVLSVPRDPRRFLVHRPNLEAMGHRRFGYGEDELLQLLSAFEVEALGYAFHPPGQIGWELSHAWGQRYGSGLLWRLLGGVILRLERAFPASSRGNEVVVVAALRERTS